MKRAEKEHPYTGKIFSPNQSENAVSLLSHFFLSFILNFGAGLKNSEKFKNPAFSRVRGGFLAEYGLKAARRAPQFSKR